MKKHILLLATGGTIASQESGEGLTPSVSSDELLRQISQVYDLCDVDTLQLMNLDSTNIEPEHWCTIANCIRDHYDAYDGFVITHGTDTMAYTAAALSYLIQNSPKPIVLTGGQKSILMQDTDARSNLYDSFLYAADDDSCGVHIVFNGEVILGTRARKERTKSYNAFSSVDYPDTAVIRDHKLIRYFHEKQDLPEPVTSDSLNTKVLLLTLIPGLDPEPLADLMNSYDGLILQTFGSGGLPGSDTGRFAQVMKRWLDEGKTVVIMTQVPYEGSDLTVYQVGRQVLSHYPVIEASNMTTEAVVTKLMWALGRSNDPETVRDLFCTPINHDRIV